MRNITFSASEELIERARQTASRRSTTLNELFREWLNQLGEGDLREQTYRKQVELISKKVRPGKRKFSRDEMNER